MKTFLKLALITLITSTAAHAAEPRSLIKVQYADLNLDSSVGAQRLLSRLKGAARDVCASEDGKGLAAYAHFTACTEQALASAIASVTRIAVMMTALSLGCAASLASHAEDVPRMKEKVSFEDLNLDSPSGAKVLLMRLKGAARDVCQPLAGFGVDEHARWEACYNQALADAVAAVDKARVTAAFRTERADVTG